MRSKLFIFLLLLLFANTLFAQQTEISIHLFGGVSVPNGDYSTLINNTTALTQRSGLYIGDDIGLATAGLGLGAELNTPVWVDGLFWTFSTSFFINGIDDSKVKQEFRSQWGDTVNVNLEFENWLNIPILTGFRYDLNFASKMIVYGIGQIGVNISNPPSWTATVDGNEIQKTDFTWARDWSFQLGIGFVYNQTYNLSIRYTNLGKPRFNGTKNLTELAFPGIYTRVQEIIGEERSVSMIIVTLGMQLFP